MKPIVVAPNPVLTTPAKTVTTFDQDLANIINDMKKTLLATKKPKGVGLAATQIGVGLRIFITRPTEASPIEVFINPEIITSSGVADPKKKLEGCLSIPDVWGNVKRSSEVTLRYQDSVGTKHEKKFSGFLAVILQHETDHLNGILYTQRVLEQKEKLYQATTDKDGNEILEEIKLS